MRPADDPWAAYEPTREDLWDLRKVAHLHRRAAFGATRAELRRDIEAGPSRSIDRLLKPPRPSARERALQDGQRDAVTLSGEPQRLKAWWLYRPSSHGPYPDLQHLDEGDLKPAIDFRRVYATLLDKWLGVPGEKVLGGSYEHLPVLVSV